MVIKSRDFGSEAKRIDSEDESDLRRRQTSLHDDLRETLTSRTVG